MPSVHETAYPRLRSSYSSKELADYSPTADELALARRAGRSPSAVLAFLVLLKTFGRLGYFVPLSEVPIQIVEHIAAVTKLRAPDNGFANYDSSGSRRQHVRMIREATGVSAFCPDARRAMARAIAETAVTKNELADLINVGLEELARLRFEFPPFAVVDRAARLVRATVARGYYSLAFGRMSQSDLATIESLFISDPSTRLSPWNDLKEEPGSPTLTHLKELVVRIDWLSARALSPDVLADIPEAKIRHFAAEARTIDAGRMRELEPRKRATLAAALLAVQSATARDDAAEMFVKRMKAIDTKAKDALAAYHAAHQQRTDALIATLREVVVAYRDESEPFAKLSAIDAVIGGRADELLALCEAHAANAGSNYNGFIHAAYRSHRATLFRILRTIELRSTSQDRGLEQALAFLSDHERTKKSWLDVSDCPLELDWIPDSWWGLVMGLRRRDVEPARLDRRNLEACAFSQAMWDLKSGDLAVIGSDHFADYRDQLVSWDEYGQEIERYGEIAGVPVTGTAFVEHVEAWLSGIAESTDRAFPHNLAVSIENGAPSIHRPEKRKDPEGLRAFEDLVASRLDPVNILDILTDTEYWLHWTQFFGPISGHETKVDDPVARHLAAVFCYGCHLGPTQTARSLGGVGRRGVAWVNLRHVTEEKLDRAIAMIINAYNRFALPKYWGTGRSASADGTKWNLYEQNLLSEFHIRYGGYGGIGYYHVSDNYVALFSRFIPCGVWEGVYILDGLIEDESDIRPDTVHSDTQGQSAPIFGLAYLLGIQLMPRIRNWKKLDFSRPSKTAAYDNIDGLFSGTVDWDLISTHLPDMLRVALSIKEGRISASTILRKLGTSSRKNKLYQAFRELGKAVRTGFLLKYIADEELRSTIQIATNKSEAFNGFTKWLAFGSDATVAANNRDEQRKIIKYNHLVANCVIFYNVSVLTRLLGTLQAEGHRIQESAVASISPYLTRHIHRFGSYSLNLDREPLPVDYDAPVVTVDDRVRSTDPAAPIRQLFLWASEGTGDDPLAE